MYDPQLGQNLKVKAQYKSNCFIRVLKSDLFLKLSAYFENSKSPSANVICFCSRINSDV